MLTLAERFKLAIEQSGKSQSELARFCGVKPPSVSDWVRGKTKTIEGEHLVRAAACLGVNPQWLATGRGPMRPTDPRPPELPASVDALLAALKEQTNDLPPTARDMVADMIARFLATPPTEQEATAKAIAAFIASSKSKS